LHVSGEVASPRKAGKGCGIFGLDWLPGAAFGRKEVRVGGDFLGFVDEMVEWDVGRLIRVDGNEMYLTCSLWT
jgi:hypothetical protein